MRFAMLAGPAAIALVAAAAADATPAWTQARRQAEACRFARANPPEISAGSVVEFGPMEPPPVSDPPKTAEAAVRAWRRAGSTNLFIACPELRANLPGNVRAATPEDYAAVSKLSAPRDIFITGFTAPFISADGRYLITSQTYRCPGLCGGHIVQLYTRRGRGWSAPIPLAMAMS